MYSIRTVSVMLASVITISSNVGAFADSPAANVAATNNLSATNSLAATAANSGLAATSGRTAAAATKGIVTDAATNNLPSSDVSSKLPVSNALPGSKPLPSSTTAGEQTAVKDGVSGVEQTAVAESNKSGVQTEAKKSASMQVAKTSGKHKHVQPHQSHQYFVCFTRSGQVSSGDIKADKEAYVYGEPGTVFSTSDHGVSLQTGCVFIGTKSAPLSVKAGDSTIDLQPNTTALVDLNYSHAVECIDGAASLSRSDGSTALALPKQQVTMNLAVPKQPVFKNPFVKEVNKSKFLLSASENTTESNKVQLHVLHSELMQASSAGQRGEEPARVFPATGAVFGVRAAHLMEVTEGAMLVDLPEGTSIATPFGVVQATKRSSIALQLSPASLFAGNCTIASTMVIKSNGHSFPMRVGRSVLVVSGIAVPGATITDGIARRRLNAYCDGCITGITADFSVLSFVQGCRSLKLAIMQPISKKETRFGGEFLKSMAALYTVTAGMGSYYAAPEIPKHNQGGEFKHSPELAKLLAQAAPSSSAKTQTASN